MSAVPFASELWWWAGRSVVLAAAATALNLGALGGSIATLAFAAGTAAIVCAWAAAAGRVPYADAMSAAVQDGPLHAAERSPVAPVLAGGAIGLVVVAAIVVVADLAGAGDAVAGVVAGLLLALGALRMARAVAIGRRERAESVRIVRAAGEGDDASPRFAAVRR